MKVSQIVVAFGLLAICFGVVSAGFLERSVYYPTTKVPGCFTNKFNGVNILELVHSEAVPTNGEPVFGVRDEIGRVGRIGQIKSNVCPIAPIATFQSGILHIGTTPCNCPNDNVTPCTPRLKLTTSTERQFVIAEALWSVPIFSFPNALSGNFALINSTVSSSAPVASQGCAAVATSLTGLYALVYAGGCSFQTKVNNAVAGGAIAVVIIQNINTPISIPQIQSSTVPVMMISYNDAQAILATTGTLAVGKPIGVPGVAGAPEVPSGLAFVPFSGLDDDADINTYNNVIRWAKGDVALDDRGYLWVVGVNGENSAKVFDLNTGINNPTLLATLVFDNYRDFLGNSRFVRFTENPSKLFLVGTDNVQGRVLVYDVTDPTNVRLVDFLNENGASKLASTADGKWLYVGSVISASNTAQFTVFSVATDGVLNRVGTVSRTDRSVVNATVSAMTANGLSLYVGWGVYGLSAYDLTRPDRPTFIASFDTYEATTFLNANSTSGVQTLCTVPDLQDVVYVGNSDTFARTSLQAFHLTRANEQFLQTSAADHLITIRTLISGGETQVDVGDQSFVLGSEIAGRHSSSSANTVGVNSDSSNAVTVQISNISELEIVSSSSEVAAPPHRHFVYQNQTLPSNVVIIQIPVPILVNSASSFVPGTTAIIAMFVTMAVVVGLL